MAQMAAEHHIDPAVARRRHCPVGITTADLHCDACSYRRVILLEVEPVKDLNLAGEKLLAENTTRTPVGYLDLDTASGKVLKATKVAKGSAWKDVPTPEI
jgi:hypothetical protein